MKPRELATAAAFKHAAETAIALSQLVRRRVLHELYDLIWDALPTSKQIALVEFGHRVDADNPIFGYNPRATTMPPEKADEFAAMRAEAEAPRVRGRGPPLSRGAVSTQQRSCAEAGSRP